MGSARPILPFGGVPVPHLLRTGGQSAQGRDYRVVNTAIGTDGEPPAGDEEAVFKHYGLLLIIVAIALGIVGVVAKGLLYLLIIGIVVFLDALGRVRPARQRAAPSWSSSGYRRRRRLRP
jgi:hypothetical protein